ncbi:hypothetical protein J437_LFUL019185, partial [Ladona fulva]
MRLFTMSLLGALGAAVLRTLTKPEDNANKVLEVKQENYSARIVANRDDSLVLYGPSDGKYEIVFHLPFSVSLYKAFSLLRTDNEREAMSRFTIYKGTIPILIETNADIATVTEVQRMCDLLVEHPTWTAAHVAAHFSYYLSLQHPLLSSSLSSVETTDGLTPLMVAIATENYKTVILLLSLDQVKCTYLNQRDHNGNSVFHHAASTTKEIITALATAASASLGGISCSLNVRNTMGHTPLHVACLSDKPNCVRALLAAGADVNITATRVSPESNSFSSSTPSPPSNVSDFLPQFSNKLHSQDMKLGGTPLHWACSRQVIEVLLDKGCEKNALNFEGQTALHVMVMRQRLECVVALLSHFAAADIGDNNGNRPLHLAAMQGSTPMIEALVIFGADINVKERFSKSLSKDKLGLEEPVSKRLKRNKWNWTHNSHTVKEFNFTAMPGYCREQGKQKIPKDVPSSEAFVMELMKPYLRLGYTAAMDNWNNTGVTPRHLAATSNEQSATLALYTLHAVGAARCQTGLGFPCQEGCSFSGTFDGLAPDPPPRNPISEQHEADYVIDQMLATTE